MIPITTKVVTGIMRMQTPSQLIKQLGVVPNHSFIKRADEMRKKTPTKA